MYLAICYYFAPCHTVYDRIDNKLSLLINPFGLDQTSDKSSLLCDLGENYRMIQYTSAISARGFLAPCHTSCDWTNNKLSLCYDLCEKLVMKSSAISQLRERVSIRLIRSLTPSSY